MMFRVFKIKVVRWWRTTPPTPSTPLVLLGPEARVTDEEDRRREAADRLAAEMARDCAHMDAETRGYLRGLRDGRRVGREGGVL